MDLGKVLLSGSLKEVFRIRNNLIRILILGSVHWITDPDIFISGFKDNNKNNFFIIVFTVGTFMTLFQR
jgi:hypothetical protein